MHRIFENAAFTFGAVAGGKEKPGSDLDITIVGKVTLREAVTLRSDLTEQIGREINPHVFTAKEFTARLKKKDHFLTTVMKEPKMFVIGDERMLSSRTDKGNTLLSCARPHNL